LLISTVVLATRNPGKAREFRALLSAGGLTVFDLAAAGVPAAEIEETGATFAENARLKALAVSRTIDLPVLADDSGLEVAALGGRPGVHSARYAGAGATDRDRIEKLLAELGPAPDRSARFVCALALAQGGAVVAEVEGECRGEIARRPQGSGGFGYDPLFRIPELGRTFAELTAEEKNRWSHRERAVRLLRERLSR
jgi:XTP/dITP diphosphohydrolase